MAGYLVEDQRKVTTHRLIQMKAEGKKIAMLTSYDFTTATITDGAGIDIILVGDSASNVMAGNWTTLPITLDQMIYHAKAVVRAVKRALVICDMPFGTYQVNETEAVTNAIRIMKETHCDALKLEGGVEIIPAVKKILDAGIPICGHLGLTPQSINKFGTYTVRAKEEAEAKKLIADAHALEDAGCFAVVLEKIPAKLATQVAQELRIPVIGIGAGGGRMRRTGPRHLRHARHDPRILPQVPPPICRPQHHHDRCHRPLRRGRQGVQLPQRERAILTSPRAGRFS